jgi:diguanylate cyclase (GGDEF)-like protein
MPTLDVLTILVLTAANLATVSVALPLIMGRGISRAARLGQVALLLQTVGWVFIIASEAVSGSWMDPVLSVCSVAAASAANMAIFLALKEWLGPRPGERVLLALTVLLPLGYALAFSNYSLRVAFANFMLAAQLLLVARATLRPCAPVSLPWRALMTGCYTVVAAFTAGRGILGGFFPELYPTFAAPHPINIGAQLAANITLVLTTVAVLVAWRDEADVKLREQAYTDSLTGLLNRHGWSERAPALFDQSRRYGTPLALLMLDLDKFKTINDSQGHEVDDRVLSLFSAVLGRHRRSSDLAARMGGEEFALLLPHTDQAAAVLIEKRLRFALQEECAAQPQLAVNYSAGLAVQNLGDTSLSAFMVRADNALYEAKAAGRGRLNIARPLIEPP